MEFKVDKLNDIDKIYVNDTKNEYKEQLKEYCRIWFFLDVDYNRYKLSDKEKSLLSINRISKRLSHNNEVSEIHNNPYIGYNPCIKDLDTLSELILKKL